MVYTGYDDDAPAASTGFVVPATHTLRVAKRGAAANQGVVTVRATEQRPFGPITEPVSLVSDGSDADFTRYVLQGTIVTADIGVNEVPPDRCVTWKAGVSGGQDDITHDGTKWTFPMNGYRGMTVTFEPAPCSGFFAPQQRVPDPTASSFAPTVAAFDGRLYMAWHGPGRDDAIYWSSFDGTHWSDEQRMPDPTASSLGPSLAAFNGRLYMAWITAGNDNSMYWASFDGTRWSEQQKLPFPGNLAPALAVFNGRLYVAWHGPGYDESIYWASFDGTQWSEQQKLAAPTATAFGPSLAVSSGRLFMAWRGPMDDEALYWASFDGSQWSDQQRLPDPVASRFQPSLAAYDGQLYMAWRGSALDEAIWWSSFDGNRWSDQHRVSDPVASHTWPSLAAYDGRLYMAWRGSLTDQAIWWTSSVLRAPGYSALPTISGSMTEGQLLTAAEGGWTGLPDSFSYQWEDCDGAGNNCSVIPGATGHTYVLTSNEVDHTIRVQVTANNSVGSSIPATSAPTSLVAPLAPPVPASTALPGISGTPQEGQTLSETHGTWTNNPTGFAYHWLRCDSAGSNCGPLSDATAQTYVPTADDVGHTLQVQETASNDGGASSPATSAATPVVLIAPPANSALPGISGTAQEGQTLSETHGTWTNNPTGFAYQWLRCDSAGSNCGPLSDATAQTYVPTADDVGHTLQVQETASNDGGASTPVTSAPTRAVEPPTPINTTVPGISGTPQEGQTLSETHGTWTNNPTGFAYQWLRCDSAGSNCGPLSDATAQTYVPTADDVGHTLQVQETASNDGGASSPATSAATPVVLIAPPANSALPGISGTAQEGQTLSETHGTWTNNPTGFAYQWLRCDSAGSNCGPLSDATAQTYVPTADDVGHTLQVQETASNQAGPSDPTASANTATVVGQVTINGTSTSVRVGCTGTATCTVNATLTTIETIEHGQPVAITAKRANVKNKVIVLGSTTVAIRGGQVDTIVIPLNSNAKRLLSTHPRLNAKLTITEAAAGKTSTVVAKTITLRIPRRRIVYGQSIDLAVAVASGTVTHRRLDLVRRMVVAGRPSGWYRVTTVWTDGRGVAHVKDRPGVKHGVPLGADVARPP